MKSSRRASAPRPPANADIWVMAGQSNMEGCGYRREALKPDRRVWCFDLQNRWRIAQDPMHDLINSTAPVDWNYRKAGAPPEIQAKGDKAIRKYWVDMNANVGAGLGIAFGAAYAQATKRPVGLVAAAHGGTSLEDWNPNRLDQGWESFYGAMLARIQLAGGNLKGILWYQGESDASPELSATYAARFAQWVKAVRRDTGIPNLPIITVQLGVVTDFNASVEGWNAMRQIQLDLPRKIANTAVTSAIDLQINDTIHIDAPGLARLGRRMARLALGLVTKKKALADGPRVVKAVARLNDRNFGETDLTITGVTGAWQPARGIHGFSVLDAAGKPHASIGVTTAFRHPRKPGMIVVRTNLLPKRGDQIAYGQGLFPICNAVDEADMPLPAFQIRI